MNDRRQDQGNRGGESKQPTPPRKSDHSPFAEAGFTVLVVEEGDWIEQGSVKPFSLEQMATQYRSGGVTVAIGRPTVAYTEGRCAGGGTEVNSGLYKRPPHEVLTAWRSDYRIADLDLNAIVTIADEVERDAIATIPAGRLGEPRELALAMLFLASPAASYVNGVNFPVDGGRLAAQCVVHVLSPVGDSTAARSRVQSNAGPGSLLRPGAMSECPVAARIG